MSSQSKNFIFPAELAEYVLDDPDHGEFEFREIIQRELLQLHDKYTQVSLR